MSQQPLGALGHSEQLHKRTIAALSAVNLHDDLHDRRPIQPGHSSPLFQSKTQGLDATDPGLCDYDPGEDPGRCPVTTIPKTPAHAIAQLARSPPPSPKRSANIGVRRSQHASTLLASPPRPGHSSCMRNIFEIASLPETLSETLPDPVSYPQLPQISEADTPERCNKKNRLSTVPPPTRSSDMVPSTPSHRPRRRSSVSSVGFRDHTDDEFRVVTLPRPIGARQRFSKSAALNSLPSEDKDSEDMLGPTSPLSSNVCTGRGAPNYLHRPARRPQSIAPSRAPFMDLPKPSQDQMGMSFDDQVESSPIPLTSDTVSKVFRGQPKSAPRKKTVDQNTRPCGSTQTLKSP